MLWLRSNAQLAEGSLRLRLKFSAEHSFAKGSAEQGLPRLRPLGLHSLRQSFRFIPRAVNEPCERTVHKTVHCERFTLLGAE